ncbi:hypothetical protein SAMN04487996_103308 [Dyadobacter soli]|uniref:Uncharacterized protein n=1 Tax=Dyadobacter soli TaxID=659014 RepID=A0A1G7A181_9BACT|nr:hypothetical protein SAMN04487996_103308 [Dyadobacter soli]
MKVFPGNFDTISILNMKYGLYAIKDGLVKRMESCCVLWNRNVSSYS